MTTYDMNHVIHHVTYDIHVTKGCITMGCNDDQSIETANFNNFWANFIKMSIIFFACCGDKKPVQENRSCGLYHFHPLSGTIIFSLEHPKIHRDEHQRNSRRETLRRSEKS